MRTIPKRFILVISATVAMWTTGALAQETDKVLYDRAIQNIDRGDYAGARLTLNTLINMYADSAYQARAKLAIAVSWLREGDAHGLAQAEAEYRDFIRFYPDMKEAADMQIGEPLRRIRERQTPKAR